MECGTVRSQLAERLSGTLTDEARDSIEQHLETCAGCRAEANGLDGLWRMLGAIEVPEPDSARLRAHVDAIIEGFQQGRNTLPVTGIRARIAALRSPSWGLHVARAAAAVALVTIGIVVGRYTPAGQRPASPDIAAMRGELHDLREMVTLSLMQQQSASERLKGVSWSGQIDRPSSDVVSALLDALMHDSNVNVRLATIDALERFASQDAVRRGAIEAVERQTSPLVQIALIDFMVKTNERESAGTLRRLAQDPQVNETVRARAAWGLQQLG